MRAIKRIQYGLTISGLIMLVIVVTVSRVHGSPSYSVTTSFYQGIEINTEMIVFDPVMLSITFKMLQELPIPPEAETHEGKVSIPLTVKPEFNLLLLMTGNDLALASLDATPFEQGDANVLESLKFTRNISGVIVGSDDPLVLMPPEETYIKIANFEYTPNETASFAYKNMTTSPEPASLVLLGLGGILVAIINLWRKKQLRRRQ